MLQVYDRVLSSRSIQTLILLVIILILLYACQGMLEVLRTRLLTRIGVYLQTHFSARIFRLMLRLPLLHRTDVPQGTQPLRDLERIQTLLSGQGPAAIFDLPWIPVYLVFIFLLHPWLGWLSAISAVLLVSLTVVTHRLSEKPVKQKTLESTERNALEHMAWRNSDVLHVMGFRHRIMALWHAKNQNALKRDVLASDITGALSVISKISRAFLQSLILALAAYLVIRGELSGGAIIASTITFSRALAPIDLVIAQWKFFVAANESKKRIETLLTNFPEPQHPMSLPPPSQTLTLQEVTVRAPGQQRFLLSRVSLSLKAGDGVGIIGPSGSGKSTLVRAIMGLWPLTSGSVRLDGATFDQWTWEDLGPHIGYMPQDIDLLEGSISQIISRFEDQPNPEMVIKAAKITHIHDMILGLPQGYDTVLGKSLSLSVGQRQRLALARALYGDPFLVVLDEPNAHLDSEGDQALMSAIYSVRQRGGIILVVAHRPSAITPVDLLAVMVNGTLQAFGPKDRVLAHMKEKSTQKDDDPSERAA